MSAQRNESRDEETVDRDRRREVKKERQRGSDRGRDTREREARDAIEKQKELKDKTRYDIHNRQTDRKTTEHNRHIERRTDKRSVGVVAGVGFDVGVGVGIGVGAGMWCVGVCLCVCVWLICLKNRGLYSETENAKKKKTENCFDKFRDIFIAQ